MKSYTIQRPSMLTAVCAPTSVSWLPAHESTVVAAAERAWLSQAYQVLAQAEPALIPVTVDGSNGTNGFLGNKGIDAGAKRMTDGASGVPPRGRPV